MSENLEIMYLQEFDMTGQNPICQMGKTYSVQIMKQFPKLKALDGYRKTVEMINMRDALPVEQDETVSYNVAHVEWYDSKALELKQPSLGKFDDTTEIKREENSLQALLNECKS